MARIAPHESARASTTVTCSPATVIVDPREGSVKSARDTHSVLVSPPSSPNCVKPDVARDVSLTACAVCVLGVPGVLMPWLIVTTRSGTAALCAANAALACD
jgi:hypothetical protein